MRLAFTVYGTPIPQGSMKAFRRGKKIIVTSDNAKLKPWRHTVTECAVAEVMRQGFVRIQRPHAAHMEVTYFFERPKSYRHPDKTTKPDLDKLLRATKDALSGVAFDDDSQVTRAVIEKKFGAPARAEIVVSTVEQRAAQAGDGVGSASAL